MKRIVTAGVCALGVGWCCFASAQENQYPHKPVRLVVAFAPGGGTDIVSRHVASKMAEGLGQQVVVDNRPGAGGTLGNEIVVRAAPDGYTINMTTSSYAVSPSVYKLSYDPVADISAISLVGISPFLLVVHPSVPVNSVKEFIEYARAHPGKLNYGSTGQGAITHLGTELLKLMANVDLTHIPYKGTGPALTDILGGQIQFMLGSILSTLPHIRTGKLRAFAVSTLQRSPAVPDLPTVSEAGVPGYELTLWYGLWGPARMPKTLVGRLNTELKRVLGLEEIKERLAREGLEPKHSTPDEFRAVIRADTEKFFKVVKMANIKVQ